MAWGTRPVSERRVGFVVLARKGVEDFSKLCREFEITRPTGYLWLKRYQANGSLQELQELSRRPHSSPGETARAIQDRVVALRQERPDWGAAKIRVLLQREGVTLPVVTIHRILLRHGLVRPQDRHLPAVRRFTREAPNDLWQMDFKGMPKSRNGCLPLALLDDHSRYLPGLFALPGTFGESVRKSLIQAFEDCGLPDAMLMDHGTPWWDMNSPLGWTQLTIWLMEQGIRLHLSGYRHPQTQGKVERCNGSMEEAMLRRPKPDGMPWQEWLDAFREEYNRVRPHEALGMDTPAQHWCKSRRVFDPNRKTWEYPVPAQVRTVGANAGVNIDGKRCYVSRSLIGKQVYLEDLDESVVVYYCQTPIRQFDRRDGSSFFLTYTGGREFVQTPSA